MPRSAVTVVNRSSYISTGTPTTLARRFASFVAAVAAGPVRAVERQRESDHDQFGLLDANETGDLVVIVPLRLRSVDRGER